MNLLLTSYLGPSLINLFSPRCIDLSEENIKDIQSFDELIYTTSIDSNSTNNLHEIKSCFKYNGTKFKFNASIDNQCCSEENKEDNKTAEQTKKTKDQIEKSFREQFNVMIEECMSKNEKTKSIKDLLDVEKIINLIKSYINDNSKIKCRLLLNDEDLMSFDC